MTDDFKSIFDKIDSAKVARQQHLRGEEQRKKAELDALKNSLNELFDTYLKNQFTDLENELKARNIQLKWSKKFHDIERNLKITVRLEQPEISRGHYVPSQEGTITIHSGGRCRISVGSQQENTNVVSALKELVRILYGNFVK